MSTTRIDAWVYWCVAHGCSGTHETQCVYANFVAPFRPCRMVKRIVVDPDNLPPERVERAARAMVDKAMSPDDGVTRADRELAEAAIRAFLSDPEPGDQT